MMIFIYMVVAGICCLINNKILNIAKEPFGVNRFMYILFFFISILPVANVTVTFVHTVYALGKFGKFDKLKKWLFTDL